MCTSGVFFHLFLTWSLETVSLTESGPSLRLFSHNLIGSGTIRRYDFVRVGMALLEEVCHCGGGT